MSNSDGYFLFRELPAGRYSIGATAFGYINNTYPLHIVELKDSDRPATVPVRLSKYAAIDGTVFDEQGEPLPGIPVTALRRVMVAGEIQLHAEGDAAVTDDRGMYRISQLTPGRYVVAVVSATTTLPASVAAELDAVTTDRTAAAALRSEFLAGGGINVPTSEGLRNGEFVVQQRGPVPLVTTNGRMLAYPTTFSPGTPLVSDASIITLGSGEQRASIDVPLRLSPSVRVAGVVTGPNGPMRHIAVRLIPPSAADTNGLEPVGVATALTDVAGRFAFLAVTPGQYSLEAPFVADANPNVGTAEASLWARQPMAIGESDVTDIRLTMKPGISISGRVELKRLNGTPAPSAQASAVMLRPVGAQLWRALFGRVGTDGNFTTPGYPPGRYVLVQPTGWTLQGVTVGGRSLPDGVIELETSPIADVVIVLSDKPTRLSGTVTDTRNTLDGEADVIVFPADTTLWRDGIFTDRRVRLVHATSAAAFEFSGLPPGEYYVAAVSSALMGDWQDSLFLDRLVPGATKITLAEAEERTTALKTFTPRDK